MTNMDRLIITSDQKAFFSIKEVAQILSLSLKTIRRYIAAGELQSILIGGVYRIPKPALEEFINSYNPQDFKAHTNKKSVIVHKNNEVQNDFDPYKINWCDISANWNTTTAHEYTFVDLFCGAGGLSKGLEMAGLNGLCGIDWFKEAGMTYRRNFKHPLIEGDIKTAEKKKEFYDTVRNALKGKDLTIVAGGFPCQGFSMSGNRIIDDPRNSLYLEMLEIVKTLKPKYVLCENVVGLRTMLGGKVEQKILTDFENAGYKMNVTTLRAADYDVPQKRDRVIFIGNRIGAINYYPKPILSPDEYKTTASAISDLMNHPNDPAFNHEPTHHSKEMRLRLQAVPEGKSLYAKYSDSWKKCPWNEASCTIKENHGGVNIHPKLPRVLTAREMARLQSFPDDFIFEGKKTKQLVQIGNAVPPLLGKAIGLSIIQSIEEFEGKAKK